MAKLKKREMIILGVMGVVALIGAVNFLLPTGKAKPDLGSTAPTEDLQTFIGNINASIGQIASRDGGVVFAGASREWSPDPFLEAESYKKWIRLKAPVQNGKTVEKNIEFKYMGYIESGGKKMAVINGAEYQENEKMDVKGFTLRRISPLNVVIENTLTGIQQTVLLQEENEVVSAPSK